MAPIAVWVTSMTRRRSQASATAPAAIEKKTMGSRRTRPTSPRARARRSGGASRETCHRMAAVASSIRKRNQLAGPEEAEVTVLERGERGVGSAQLPQSISFRLATKGQKGGSGSSIWVSRRRIALTSTPGPLISGKSFAWLVRFTRRAVSSTDAPLLRSSVPWSSTSRR